MTRAGAGAPPAFSGSSAARASLNDLWPRSSAGRDSGGLGRPPPHITGTGNAAETVITCIYYLDERASPSSTPTTGATLGHCSRGHVATAGIVLHDA